MYKSIKYSVFTFTALFLLSCQNDELENKQENAKVAKTNLELAKFSNLNIAQNVEADFEKVNEIEKDNFKISEFSAKEKIVNTFESNVLQNQLKYQGVTIENEGKSQSYFLEVYTLAKSAAYPQSITKLKGFTGGLNVYSFTGENLGSVVVRNGEAKNISEKEDLDVLTKAINLFYVPSDITSKIPLCDATYTQTVWLTQDVWRIISNGPKILEVIYVGEKVTKSTNILPYPCDGSGDVEAIKLQRMAHYYRSDGKSYSGLSNLAPVEKIEINLVMPPPPEVAISDIKKFLSCFSVSATANLTVYAERMGGGNGVGHAFIGISQGSNTAIYGYYPKTTLGSLSGPGIMGENGGHHYNVSASMTITGAQLNEIIALSQVYQSNWYDLGFNNCSDFATEVLNITGVSTSGVIDTPDTVADILSTLKNHVITSNNAPKTNRTCP